MHDFDLILARAAVSQKWLQGGRDRDEEGEDIVQRDVVCRPYAVGAVLASTRVAYADLMLIMVTAMGSSSGQSRLGARKTCQFWAAWSAGAAL